MLPLTRLTIDELNEALTKKSRRQQLKEDAAEAKDKVLDRLLKKRTIGKRPTQEKRAEGWNSLLSEISESSRRIRVAKGGHFTVKSEMKIENAYDELEPEPVLPVVEERLQSKPPTAASAQIATSAPAHELNVVPPTPRSMDHTAEINMNKDEGDVVWRSYRCDENVVTDEALNILWRRAVDPKHFTSEVPTLQKLARMSVDKRDVEALPVVHDIQYWRQLKKKRREHRKQTVEAETFPPLKDMFLNIFGEEAVPEPPSTKEHRQGLARNVLRDAEETEMPFDQMMECMAQPVKDIEKGPETMPTQHEPDKIGAQQSGRRDAFDNGLSTEPLVELRQTKRRKARESQMASALARSKDGKEPGESLEVKIASGRVREAAELKVQRLEVRFLQKKAQLSARLQRRVERLRKDHEETHDTKVNSILPSVVASATSRNTVEPQPKAKPRRADTVLHYLRHHRHLAEKERQSHHSIYLQQVETFQTFLKRISDPNRAPDRGEAYLSEAFRYVLSAGMVVDEHYFFRVMQFLQDSDFESTPTVNMLAACCASFDIDLNRYTAYLRSKEIPMYVPRARSNLTRPWEDWEVWNGVKIEQRPEEGIEEGIEFQEDPMPFRPIVAEETPSASEALSRGDDDALSQLLQQVSLDAPLERYIISPRPRETEDEAAQDDTAQESQALGGSMGRSDENWRSKLGKPGRALAKGSAASERSAIGKFQGAAPMSARAPQRPDAGEKRRSARQPPMEAIAERPHLERAA
jgi:hypothetical protein